MAIAELAALGATSLGALGVVPQVRKLLRTGDTCGLSLTYAAVGMISELGWLAYSVHRSLWAAVPDAVLLVLANLLLAAVLLRAKAPFLPAVRGSIVYLGGLMIVAVVGGSVALGVMLSLGHAAQLASAVWAVFRAASPSGVARLTWWTAIIESALWSAFGLVSRDPAFVLFGLAGLVASTAILVRVSTVRSYVVPLGPSGGLLVA